MDKRKKIYQKRALTVAEQLKLLASSSLSVVDYRFAESTLKTVSYHRLSGYFHPFLATTNPSLLFKNNTSFSDIWALYTFDRELRLLVSDAIERIEVAFRASLTNVMSIKYGPYWYMDQQRFRNYEQYLNLMILVKQICKSKHEPSIIQFYNKYSQPEFPPFWLIIENISFGACSKMFRNIKKVADKKEICSVFEMHPTLVDSWISTLTYTRNLCAHHARLWNRWFVIEPKDTPEGNIEIKNKKPFYKQAYILDSLLHKVAPNNDWKQRLYSLFEKNLDIPIYEMGFSNNWKHDPFWS